MAVGVIPRMELLERLADPADQFMISPLPDKSAVGHGSIDLRVGNLFLTAERSSLDSLDASKPWEGARVFSQQHIRTDRTFVMQPRQFALAGTLEYLAMPKDMAALIQSRSTYGRMGLIAATAAYIHPGYKGCPTLELVNLGEVPIAIQPYLAICQLIMFSARETDEIVTSRYHCATRPHFARPPLRPSG